jgi:hypothetical protein
MRTETRGNTDTQLYWMLSQSLAPILSSGSGARESSAYETGLLS